MRKIDVVIILALVIIAILTFNKYFHKERSVMDDLGLGSEMEYPDSSSSEKDREERFQDQEILRMSRQNSITRAVEKVHPAVVSVNVIKTEIVRRYINPFENPFFGFFDYVPYKREIQGIGSGVIFSDQGYVITNAHVVEGATQIKVILADGRQLDGDLVGYDSVHDVAILKMTGEDLPSARLGNSSDLIIGEWAIAVGNPYGLLIKDSKPSVSVGVISAVDRNFAENNEGKIYRRMIQTDAAINPGNSGGPLVNIYGEVIGINTFIFSESGGSIGIGFAIPIDRVKTIAQELIEHGKVRDVWFGFKVQEITPMLANYLNLEGIDGVMVTLVDKNGPADTAGLQRGDIIRKINGNYIKKSDDAELAVSDVNIGDNIVLQVERDRQQFEIVIKAVEYK